MRPPTLLDFMGSPFTTYPATARVAEMELGPHHDCAFCQFFDVVGAAGEHCAFEGAYLCDRLNPELLRLFGWMEPATDPGQYWTAPTHCPWFASKDAPPVPFDDPRQLDVFAERGSP